MTQVRVLLSVATSLDGYIDDASDRRLVLSGPADLDDVDAERAAADAILVGANTVRRDDPALRVRSAGRIAQRVAAGRPPQPVRVAISSRGGLDPAARFFGTRDRTPLVYLPSGVTPPARLAEVATVVGAGDPLDPARVLADLHRRGVRRLLVEGGTGIHTLFLGAGLVDEIRLAVAPLFVGDPAAPRFVGPGAFPPGPEHRMRLVGVRTLGDVAVLRYSSAQADQPVPGEPELLQPLLVGRTDAEQQAAEHREHHPPR